MTDIAEVIEFKTNDSSGSYADFTLDMSRVPLEIHDNERYEMAALNGYVKLNTPNISASLNNNSWSMTIAGVPYNLFLGDGRYSLYELNNYMERALKSVGGSPTGIRFVPITEIGHLMVTLEPTYTFQPGSGFAEILGFDAISYTATSVAPRAPKLDEGITYVNLVCDVIERNLIPSNGGLNTNDGILETFTYNGIASSTISLHSDYLTWRPIRQHSGHITNMRFRLLDQDGKLIRMSEPVYIIIGLRVIK